MVLQKLDQFRICVGIMLGWVDGLSLPWMEYIKASLWNLDASFAILFPVAVRILKPFPFVFSLSNIWQVWEKPNLTWIDVSIMCSFVQLCFMFAFFTLYCRFLCWDVLLLAPVKDLENVWEYIMKIRRARNENDRQVLFC